MNKLIFTTTFFGILIFSAGAKAQENTLPTQGNVGIGTMNPTSRLDVNGTMKVDSCLIVNDTLITMHDARIGETLKVEGDLVVPNLGPVVNYDSAKLLFVDGDGFILKGGATDAIEHLSGLIYSKQCPADPFADVPNPVWTNGTNKIFVDCPPVYVGINTSTPKVHLDVRGTTSTGNLAVGVDPLSMQGKMHVKTNIPEGTDGIVLVVENNIRRLMELDNSGLLRAREIKVDAFVWPDYVFEKDYELMSLEEVEAYIQQEGHLPNVPSAEVIEAEGMNLAEMNKVLMEKVEELTLYLIEQQKQIEEQNARILLLETK